MKSNPNQMELDDDDFEGDVGDDLFTEDVGKTVLEELNRTIGGRDATTEEGNIIKAAEANDEYDEEDLQSEKLEEGSDEYPVFNPNIDFARKITLKAGLIFSNVRILRLAIQQRAIENKYDFYSLHNYTKRFDAFCVDRCDKCAWNRVRGKRVKSTCDKLNCTFHLYSSKLRGEESMHIKTSRLEHQCWNKHQTKKLTSKFSAERYFEVWRGYPEVDLVKGLQHKIKEDFGIVVGYQKCCYTRARAKVMLYGDGVDQYKRVYDYANAVRKHNPGSSALEGFTRDRKANISEHVYMS